MALAGMILGYWLIVSIAVGFILSVGAHPH
jgi:hypothetical protein